MMKRAPVLSILGLLAVAVTPLIATLGTGRIAEAGNCDAFVHHMEFTQAVQHEDNSIPLIENKPLTVRAYLAVPDGCPTQYTVNGTLTINNGVSITDAGTSATGAVVEVDDSLTWNRG